MLANMTNEKRITIALGIIRDLEAPVYDQCVRTANHSVQAKNPTRKLQEFLMKGEVWEVK
jgi:2-oxoglutarate ferredoxin oxidoreductase subunit beta